MKATKPERSSLPLSHIGLLIFMRLPIFPPLFFPQTIWTWKTWKAQIPGVAYHSLTWSHPADTNHDRLAVQSRRSSFHQGILVFFTVWHHQPMPSACFENQNSKMCFLLVRCFYVGFTTQAQHQASFCCYASCWLLFTAKPHSVARC